MDLRVYCLAPPPPPSVYTVILSLHAIHVEADGDLNYYQVPVPLGTPHDKKVIIKNSYTVQEGSTYNQSLFEHTYLVTLKECISTALYTSPCVGLTSSPDRVI